MPVTVIEVRRALGFQEPHVVSTCERAMDSRMRRSLDAEAVRAAMSINSSSTAWAARQWLRPRSRSSTRRLAAFHAPERRADLSGMTPEQLKAAEAQIIAEMEKLGWVECQITGQFIRRKVDPPQLARRKLPV